MNHAQVTIKLWRDTREILRQISRMTREPQVLVLHRLLEAEHAKRGLLMVEQRRLRVGSGDVEGAGVEVPATDANPFPGVTWEAKEGLT